MKNLRKLFGIISIVVIIACAITACQLFETPNETPVAGDYEIGNLKQSTGSVTAVTIKPKSGKSGGAITIYYEGTDGSAKSTTIPQNDGAYIVTFDVAAASGWNAASGLYAGTLIVGIPTPVASDFNFSNLTQTVGKVTGVIITPKEGRSTGKIKIYYTGIEDTTYPKSDKVPDEAATGSEYAVTFDVAAADGWKAATGLSAGTLEINDNKTPVFDDYNVTGWGNVPSTGSAIRVTVARKDDRDTSPGRITVKYNGETNPPSSGSHKISFDVEETTGWNAATNLTDDNLYLHIGPASSTDSNSISTEIIGTPEVGKRLTADVKKNFAGELLYQWYVNGQEIRGEDWYIFYPMPPHSGKQITVKVTCKGANGDKSATSPAVTIPAMQWTPTLEQYGTRLYAQVQVGEFSFNGTEEGFSTEWFRDGEKFTNPNGYWYDLAPVDAGTKISVKIIGYGATKSSPEISIPAAIVPVIPDPTIEYNNIAAMVPQQTLKEMAWNIERAYDGNINDCKTAIDGKRAGGAWCIDFYTNEDAAKAEIVDGKLHIHFSTDWYDSLPQNNDAVRLSDIGQELAFLANTATFISRYSGNFEDIRMAKLATPELKKTLADLL